MAGSVTATIVVQFGAEGEAHLSAEVDARSSEEGGLNGDRTQFAPGDTVYFLVYKSANVVIDDVVSSAGTLASHGTAVVVKEDDLQFPNQNTANFSVPAEAITAERWLGTNLGPVSIQPGGMAAAVPTPGASPYAGVCRTGYSTTALVYSITAPASLDGLTSFPILIYILGHQG